jgi:hypothetical protein
LLSGDTSLDGVTRAVGMPHVRHHIDQILDRELVSSEA